MLFLYIVALSGVLSCLMLVFYGVALSGVVLFDGCPV
jgi:hypothetical protein